jgi:ribosomal protein S19E (S16A)
MIGEAKQTFFTVKDVSAQEFIEAFAQYLKKNNLIELPNCVSFVKTATSIIHLIQETN